jgi:hypothetical protein
LQALSEVNTFDLDGPVLLQLGKITAYETVEAAAEAAYTLVGPLNLNADLLLNGEAYQLRGSEGVFTDTGDTNDLWVGVNNSQNNLVFETSSIGNDFFAFFESEGGESEEGAYVAEQFIFNFEGANEFGFDDLDIAVANGSSVVTSEFFVGSLTVLGVTQLDADNFVFGLA